MLISTPFTHKAALTVLCTATLLGCQHQQPVDSSVKSQITSGSVSSGDYRWNAIRSGLSEGGELRVYLAGELTGWTDSVTTYSGSDLSRKLFDADTASGKLYLGFPCHTGLSMSCNTQRSSDSRFSLQLGQQLGGLLRQLKKEHQAARLVVIGVGDSAPQALIAAAGVPEIDAIITVRGAIDFHEMTKVHGVAPDALSPSTASERLQNLAQNHWVSTQDKEVPEAVAKAYKASFRDNRCIRIRVLTSGANGTAGNNRWQQLWPVMLQDKPKCQPMVDTLSEEVF